MSNTEQPIFVESRYQAPVSKVWKALTDNEEMKLWYFDVPEFKAEPGFAFEFTSGPTPERQYLHHCMVTEAITENKIAYTWRYEGYAGDSLVTFELTAEGNNTILKLTHHGVETFPQDNPDLLKENFVKGWDGILNTTLKNYLEPTKD
jgi:uncharacterized protein YndB with AHSA1/START domain